jgi:hypothetical protein
MHATNHNPLPLIFEAFIIAQESLKAVKEIVKNSSHYPRSVLQKMPTLLNSSSPQQSINKSMTEIEDLFVLNLWATFERWLRDYLQKKGDSLKSTMPEELGEQLYKNFIKEVEYWKPENMLDILKNSIFADSQENQRLVGHAKQILDYRNWIAHGRNQNRLPQITHLLPSAAYQTLNTIINLVEPSQPQIN